MLEITMSEFGYAITISCLVALIVLYGFFELHYFLRMCLCVAVARCFKRKCHILATTHVSGVCLTNDVDTLLYHMNNARYLRECDFARVDFYERTNLYRTIRAMGGSVYQGAATIRYRRFIRPFHRFIITSRIIYWDESSVFMEHRFLRPSDQFVHSIAICRQRIIDCSTDDVMNELLMTPKYAATATCTQQPQSAAAAAPPQAALTGGSNNANHTTISTTNLMGNSNSSTMHLQASQQSILSVATHQTDAAAQLQLENGQLQQQQQQQQQLQHDEHQHQYNQQSSPTSSPTRDRPTTTTTTTTATTSIAETTLSALPQMRMKPTPPPEVLKWIEYNDLSSKSLRKLC